jgi:myosin-7
VPLTQMKAIAPHIFALAEATYVAIREKKTNQSVVISGESGAGKTESTKLILQFLTAVSSRTQSWVQQQILETNSILESFGNAKTARNNNSSRFGKFMQIQFSAQHEIVGANIVNYLLEKSRVAKQGPQERNYHVFYQLLAGASEAEKQALFLEAPESYAYLNKSGCIKLDGDPDRKHFERLKLAFDIMNMDENACRSIFAMLSAILQIGNLVFNKVGEEMHIANDEVVQRIATLLKCDLDKLRNTFRFRQITVRNETSMIPLRDDQVCRATRFISAIFCPLAFTRNQRRKAPFLIKVFDRSVIIGIRSRRMSTPTSLTIWCSSSTVR